MRICPAVSVAAAATQVVAAVQANPVMSTGLPPVVPLKVALDQVPDFKTSTMAEEELVPTA